MDPCECLFNHEALMRRILSILRDSQTDCTDTECNTGAGGDPASAGSNMMLLAMAWGLFAMFMFFMRPSSMRSGGSNREEGHLEGKPNSTSAMGNNNGNGGGNNDDGSGGGGGPGVF